MKCQAAAKLLDPARNVELQPNSQLQNLNTTLQKNYFSSEKYELQQNSQLQKYKYQAPEK